MTAAMLGSMGVASYTLALMAVLSIGVLAAAARLTRANREIARLAELVRSSTDAIIGLTPGGEITSWNSGAERLYGYTAGEITGRSTSILVPSGCEDDLQELLHRLRAGDHIESYEAVRSRKDGCQLDVSLAVSALRNRAGEFTGASMIARDITAHKRIERGVASARDQALQASRVKSEFVANMSHEIRTPLNGIIGMAELLRDTSLDRIQLGYVDALAASGEALLSVVNDVLDFSKIEAGHMELHLDDFELRRAVEEACFLLAELARGKGLQITHVVDEDVPVTVHGDRGRLRQVILNLLSNAVKFTDSGEIRVRVSVGQADQLRFVVSDTGIGIEQEDVKRLFEAFVQADQSTTRRHGGTGLGLAISRDLVRRMGGEIGAAPREGGGSVFWFTAQLPAVSGVAASLPGPVPRSAGRRLSGLGGPAILIAEDNEINRTVAKALLSRRGLRSVVAHNGLQAVEMAARTDYLAILMDCQMPELDGYEATLRIRAAEHGHHVPIIAMTAHSMHGDRARCLAAGMDDYLSKPIRDEELDTIIARWLPDVQPGDHSDAVSLSAGSDDLAAVPARVGSLDQATLLQLHDTLPAQMRESLLATFEESLPQCLLQIEEAVAREDQIGVRRVAHLLRGSSATLGAADLALICQRLEHTSRREDPDTGPEQLEQLHATAGEACRALREGLL
jgi:two-component system, sensor histidine kinase and response regulator